MTDLRRDRRSVRDIAHWIRRQLLTGYYDTKNWEHGNRYLLSGAVLTLLTAIFIALHAAAELPAHDNQFPIMVIIFGLALATDWHTVELDRQDFGTLHFPSIAGFAGAFYLDPLNMLLVVSLAKIINSLLDTFSYQALFINVAATGATTTAPLLAFVLLGPHPYEITIVSVLVIAVAILASDYMLGIVGDILEFFESSKKERTGKFRAMLEISCKRTYVGSKACAVAVAATAACLLLLSVSYLTLLLIVPISTLALIALNRHSRPRRDASILKLLFHLTHRLQTSGSIDESVDLLVRELVNERGGTYAELLLRDGHHVRSTRFALGDTEPCTTVSPYDSKLADFFDAVTHQLSFRQSDGSEFLQTRFSDLRLKVLLAAPLTTAEGAQGVLLVGSRYMSYGVFMKSKPEALGAFANVAATALRIDQLISSVGQLDAAQEHLWHQATHDALTGLANRRLFAERAQHALNSRDPRVAIICVDLDHLKVVNDQLGHAVGDQLIKTAATFFESICDPADTVARLGGDEFAILVENADEEYVRALTFKITSEFEVDYLNAPVPITAGASAGYALLTEAMSLDQALLDADAQLYANKLERKSDATSRPAEA